MGSIWNQFRASRRLSLIAGPCVIEREALRLRVAIVADRTQHDFRLFQPGDGHAQPGTVLEPWLRIPKTRL
jgi:hypothetical protein